MRYHYNCAVFAGVPKIIL